MWKIHLRKISFTIFVVCALAGFLAYSISKNLKTQRNDVSISLNDPQVGPLSLNLAVVSDTHLHERQAHLTSFRELVLAVKASGPDLVVFVGDYIAHPTKIRDLSGHRENIANIIKLLEPLPSAAVLGNYESWSNADRWLSEFERLGINVLENEVRVINTAKGNLCVRGLGDRFTNRYQYVEFPDACGKLPKITITHDPAGAFYNKAEGFFIAGHTHCGQISLPLIGPLWVPSDAPKSAHCGLYQDDMRSVFVTSGVGTSILPLRFGTRSYWDMLNLIY